MTRAQARLAFLGAVVAGALASACASVPDDAGFSEVARAAREREGVDARWQKGARDADTDAVVNALLAKELDLNGAVQLALLRNPRLQSMYEQLDVSRASLIQALLPRNPEVDVGVRVGLPSLASFELDASIVEDVVSLLLIPLRARLASAELDRAKLVVSDAVMSQVAVVKDAYLRHVAARELLAIETTYAVAAEAAAELAERQRAAGTDTELFHATRVAETFDARLRAADAETLVVETRERLLRAMGLFGKETALRLPDRLPPLPVGDATLDDVEARAVSARLDLAAAQIEIDIAAQRLGLAQPWFIPFFDGGLEFESEDDGMTIGPRVGFALPIADWGQARRVALEAQKRAAERDFEALAIDIRSRVREAAARMTAARAKVELVNKSLLPARKAQLELSVLHYNRMMIGVFDLLRARQAQLDAEREEIHAREMYWTARAELERATGARLPYVMARTDAPTAPPPSPAASEGAHPHEHNE